jgi:16S rRNA processing protein RimM
MEWIPVGKVVSAHGMRGEIKFYYYNEVKEDFLLYTSLFVVSDDVKTEIRPLQVRFHKNFVYITIAGLRNAADASFLIGKELYVREKDLPAVEEGEYYEYQLIGLDVINMQRKKIGSVESILRTGANDVLVVTGEEDYMVPMVEGYIEEIDVRTGFIRVNEETIVR